MATQAVVGGSPAGRPGDRKRAITWAAPRHVHRVHKLGEAGATSRARDRNWTPAPSRPGTLLVEEGIHDMTATSAAPVAHHGSPLRWLADTYEQAQRIRIETGERIRAIIQRRDTTFVTSGAMTVHPDATDEGHHWIDETGTARTPDQTLAAIAAGETLGPVSILGRTYLRHWQEEREIFREMGKALRDHPAYPWLSQVKGIGPTLGCKLLARFDATLAPYASSFWAYAGLDTIRGTLYRCAACGVERSFPPTHHVTGAHKRNGNGALCEGKLEPVRDAECRVARPRHASGEKAKYDAYAKKIMYLVGTSFLKSGGPYEEHYRQQRARLDDERPAWTDGRRHLTALRITEKLFLAHLWEVWRTALGLPTPRPWVETHGGHDPTSHIGPWSMIKTDGA